MILGGDDMKLNKKFLSLVSSFALFSNSTSKMIDTTKISNFIYENEIPMPAVWLVGGATAALPLAGIPAIGESISDSIKERSKGRRGFLKILKKNLNEAFEVIKWTAGILAGLSAIGQAIKEIQKLKDERDDDWGGLFFKLPLCASLGACLTSWIGEKLTEDKKET